MMPDHPPAPSRTRRHILRALLVLVAIVPIACAQSQETWYEIDELPLSRDAVNLRTPQACVESFVDACHEDDFDRAALSLDLRLLQPIDDLDAARLAEHLFFVLNQELWIDWETLPDRPDGVVEPGLLGRDGPLVGTPRRSIRIGAIDLAGREIPIRIHRVKPGDADPVWLFSAQTVENIDALYQEHGPSWIARSVPPWASARLGGVQVWQIVALAITFVGAPWIGWIVGTLVFRRLVTLTPNRLSSVASTIRWPAATLVAAIIIWIVVEWLLPLPSAIAAVTNTVAVIGVAAAGAWLAMRIVDMLVRTVATGAIKDVHDEESDAHRRLLTQVTIARYALMLGVVLVGVGVVLIQLDLFRTVGIALLTSAGAAAVVIGIAGHAVLGNLIAGLQIALSQPVKIGDTVIVEDNWGSVEDITYTYVVIRTWDERRLVVPVSHFVSETIENWSMTDPFLTKPIYLHLDYRADVDRVREKFLEVLEGDEDWDEERDEPKALVTDTSGDTITVRLTAAGATPSEAWSLSCRVRERMLAWLRDVENGRWLPVQRIHLRDGADAPA